MRAGVVRRPGHDQLKLRRIGCITPRFAGDRRYERRRRATVGSQDGWRGIHEYDARGQVVAWLDRLHDQVGGAVVDFAEYPKIALRCARTG